MALCYGRQGTSKLLNRGADVLIPVSKVKQDKQVNFIKTLGVRWMRNVDVFP